jgi:dipeptidyl aminopeptidase/acylaminoacyl peptidase
MCATCYRGLERWQLSHPFYLYLEVIMSTHLNRSLARAGAVAAAAVTSAIFALPANAAFHGGNGLIAYTGPDGGPTCVLGDPSCGMAVWTVEPDGSHARKIASSSQKPSWSPFGSELVVQFHNGDAQVTNLLRPGGEYEFGGLTPGPDDLSPAFSGDAKHVFIMRDGGIARAARTGQAQLVQIIRAGNSPASSGSSQLAYERGGDIWTANQNGGHVKRVTKTKAREGAPNWSPNGKQIVFARGAVNHRQIWVMNSNGTHQKRLTRGADDAGPAYSPDGRFIAFSRFGRLMVMNANGSGIHQIASQGLDPDWQPLR